jgi:hypothetical protein
MNQKDKIAQQLLCAAGAMCGWGDSRFSQAAARASCTAGTLGAEAAGILMTHLFHVRASAEKDRTLTKYPHGPANYAVLRGANLSS